jgi:hypothetical protein
MTMDCVLLNDKIAVFAARLGPECPILVDMTTCGVAPAGTPVRRQ